MQLSLQCRYAGVCTYAVIFILNKNSLCFLYLACSCLCVYPWKQQLTFADPLFSLTSTRVDRSMICINHTFSPLFLFVFTIAQLSGNVSFSLLNSPLFAQFISCDGSRYNNTLNAILNDKVNEFQKSFPELSPFRRTTYKDKNSAFNLPKRW